MEVFWEEAGFIDEAWLPGTVRARKAEKKEAKKGREGGCVGMVAAMIYCIMVRYGMRLW